MDYQRAIQRSRIPEGILKTIPSKDPCHCECCSSRPSSPDINCSAAPLASERSKVPTFVKPVNTSDIVPVEPAPGPVSLETAQSINNDGTTEDTPVQWLIPTIEGEQQHIQGLNSLRLKPSGGKYIKLSTGGILEPDKQSVYSLDIPTRMSNQNEFALYLRFGKLNCLNLLHLQQRLYDLERKLEELDNEELSVMEYEAVQGYITPDDIITETDMDRGRGRRETSTISELSGGSKSSARSTGSGGLSAHEKAYRQAVGCEDGPCDMFALPVYYDAKLSRKALPLRFRRCKLMEEVAKALEVYNGALLAYSKTANLPYASTRDIHALKDWLQHAENPLTKKFEALQFLIGTSTDAIALPARQTNFLHFYRSYLLSIIRGFPDWRWFLPWTRKEVVIGRSPIQSRLILMALRSLTYFCGALLTVAPVVMMYTMKDQWARSLITCVFTAMFAGFMHVFTASEKKEVLMATTGYTAVLVMLVGSEAFADIQLGGLA